MRPSLCNILNVSVDASSLLSIPEPPSLPTDPSLLNLLSVYLLYVLIIILQSDGAACQDLAAVLRSPQTQSILSWLPFLSSFPTEHVDYLLTRAYTAINAICSSVSSPLTIPANNSPESIFVLRIYALCFLVHTSPGLIDPNTFWNQAMRHTGIFVKATPSKGHEQITPTILHAFDNLMQFVEKRKDRDVFLEADETGKGFRGFCDCWTGFANRVGFQYLVFGLF